MLVVWLIVSGIMNDIDVMFSVIWCVVSDVVFSMLIVRLVVRNSVDLILYVIVIG